MSETQSQAPIVDEPVSVVIPVYQEAQSLTELYEQLRPVLDRFPGGSEVLFVDDGSTDSSKEIIHALHAQDPRIRGVFLRRNFGKAIALTAGFRHAKGEIIVTMDGDLQDDPNDIPVLLAAIAGGADLACGWKHEGKGPMGKSLPSRVFNYVVSRVTGVRLNDMNCPLKAYRKIVLKEIDVYGDLYRFIPVLAHQVGFIYKEVPVKNRARKYGTSKYGLERFMRGFFDLFTVLLLTRYAKKPLHFFGTIALLLGALGSLTIVCLMAYTWSTVDNPDWSGTPSRPLFFFGILAIMIAAQVFSIGLIGELLSKILHRSEQAPSVKDVIE